MKKNKTPTTDALPLKTNMMLCADGSMRIHTKGRTEIHGEIASSTCLPGVIIQPTTKPADLVRSFHTVHGTHFTLDLSYARITRGGRAAMKHP